MPAVQFDLRGLAAQQPPSRRHVASVVDDAEEVHVLGPVPALAAVLARLWRKDRLPAVPVSWAPADDPASTGLARSLGLGTGAERELPLVRDDHGGVLLSAGRVTAFGEQRRVLSRRFGAQAYCDDARVANGEIARIDVRPDWTAVDRLSVAVVTVPLRTPQRATGRALQIACAPAQVVADGVPFEREVTRWTWYADDRVRWRLRP
ncbi:hypothetical protein [Modestobacter versicolor]|uniref:Uncharacterized protein n=1 Tax=Modestobacter versicolor TaxID=429133 RepID=A0A323V424_9ACTN|nr:hypothetical protein [Modestobacter versicolor]MBB3677798.1 hypothetical protein [Modestobacter versicolor]PZA19567.1 hypothetical protein DMO24_20045 [Modestobacter versicolor]